VYISCNPFRITPTRYYTRTLARLMHVINFNSSIDRREKCSNLFYFNSIDDEDCSLRKLVDAFWDWRLRHFPEIASMIGFTEYNDLLESFDEFDINERYVS